MGGPGLPKILRKNCLKNEASGKYPSSTESRLCGRSRTTNPQVIETPDKDLWLSGKAELQSVASES